MVRNRLIRLIAAAMLATGPVNACAQDANAKDAKVYGSRVGDRDDDPNNTGVIGNGRINRRIDSRLDSRLNTRLDRFSMMKPDRKSAYTPKPDDRTKTSE